MAVASPLGGRPALGALPRGRLLTAAAPRLDVAAFRQAGRTVVHRTPQRPALVLGSTQPEEVVDEVACAELGVQVLRRRSGGGAVLVDQEDPLWVDVWLPAGDALWLSDVRRAAQWVGEWWQSALETLGVGEGRVHGGPPLCGPGSDLCCFAGVGPGELVRHERKVVGLAQWRAREGALFHCAAYRRWDPTGIARLLRLSDERRASLLGSWRHAAMGVDVEQALLRSALEAALPAGEHWVIERDRPLELRAPPAGGVAGEGRVRYDRA